MLSQYIFIPSYESATRRVSKVLDIANIVVILKPSTEIYIYILKYAPTPVRVGGGKKVRSKIKIGIAALLLLGAGLVVMAMTPAANADTWKSVTATAHWKNAFGQTIITTKLTQNWMYTGSKITWYGKPQYTWSKAWWVVWAYESGLKTGTWVENPEHYNIGWGTGHWNVGIPTPWGNVGLTQDLYTKIGYYDNGDYWTESGFGYLS